MEPPETYPSFKPLLEKGYIALLHAAAEDAAATVAEVHAARRQSGSAFDAELTALFLSSPNWRPQLLGAAALFFGATPPQIATLWQAIDNGSWISPQLAATAYHVDPNFRLEAVRRIKSATQIKTTKAKDMSWLERYFPRAPNSLTAQSTKLLAALIALLKVDADDRERLDAPQIIRVTASDTDRGGEKAVCWLKNIRSLAAQQAAEHD